MSQCNELEEFLKKPRKFWRNVAKFRKMCDCVRTLAAAVTGLNLCVALLRPTLSFLVPELMDVWYKGQTKRESCPNGWPVATRELTLGLESTTQSLSISLSL